VHGLAAAPSELEGSDSQPGAFLAAGSPLRALPARHAARDGFGVRITKKKKKKK